MQLTDALAIEVGLDPKALRKGLAEVSTSMRKAREGAQKDGTAIEKSLDGAAEAVDRLARNALKLFALFTAGRAVKDFVQDITSADAALGRLAKSIGSTPEAISSLANAVARGGGSAAATAGSFEKLSDSINEIKVTGNSSLLPMFGRLQGISGKAIRLNQDLATTFGDIADAAKGTADKMGAPFATYLLKQAGIDRDTAALLIQGRAKLNEALEKSRKVGIVSDKDTKAAQALTTSIETLRQTSESFGRQILTGVSPTITRLITQFQEWIEKNRGIIDSKIAEYIQRFSDYINSINWEAVGEGLRNFGAGALKVADSFGGLLKICEALFLFWIGSKAIRMVQAILGIAGLLGTGPLGWAIRLAMAGSLASDLAVPNAEKPGVITRSDDENSGAAVGPSGGHANGNIARDRGIVRDYAGRAYRGVKRLFGGGAADAAEGGAGIRTRASRGGRGDRSGGVAANPGAYKDVLDHIARSEGTAKAPGGGYNTSLANGALLPGGKEQDLTKMTLDQIDALQTGMLRHPSNKWNSSAIGRYQIVRTTLRAQREKLGLKGTDLYDEKLQDRIGANLARQRGADPVGLKNEWASLVGAKNAVAVALMQKVDPKASTMPLDQARPSASGAARRPEVLADPGDERRKPAEATVAEVIAAVRTVKSEQRERAQGTLAERAAAGYEYGPQTPYPGGRSLKQMNEQNWPNRGGNQPTDWKQDKDTGNWKPVFGDAKPSAAINAQRAGAMAAIVQARAAQAAVTGNTSNDNRATTDNSSQWSIQNVNLHTAATDGRAAAGEFVDTIRGRSYAAAANRGLA